MFEEGKVFKFQQGYSYFTFDESSDWPFKRNVTSLLVVVAVGVE